MRNASSYPLPIFIFMKDKNKNHIKENLLFQK